MKTAAVIGARAMLGRQLVQRLRERGVDVLTVGRSADDDICLDLASGELDVAEGLRADTVFHCAAAFADDSPEGVRTNFAVNAQSALAVSDLVSHLGSDTLVYAGSASSDHNLDPANFGSYGLTKAIAEQILGWAMAKRKGRFSSLRFTQIYDTYGICCHHQPWFGRVIAYTSRGQDIRMPASLGPRNFLHARDAADLMIRAAETEISGEIDVTHPQSLTTQEIAEIAYGVFAKGGAVVTVSEKAPFRAVNFVDTSDSFKRLGLEPQIDMRAGIVMIRDAGTAAAFGPMDIT